MVIDFRANALAASLSIFFAVPAFADAIEMIGSIDNHYGISVSLTPNGTVLAGKYSYSSVGKPLKLQGTIDAAGKVHLNESDASGKKTGTIDGTLLKDEFFTGTWADPKKDKQLPFFACKDQPGILRKGENGVLLAQNKRKLHFKGVDAEKANPSVSSPALNEKLLSDAQSAKVLQKSLLPKEVYGNLNDYSGWLINIDYSVDYNKNNLLDVEYSVDGSGAYPDTALTHVLVDTRSGKPVTAKEAFKAESLAELKRLVNKRMDAAIKQATKENGDISDLIAQNKSEHPDPLAVFAVTDQGVTFKHNWGFPHVAKAAEPDSDYLFKWTEIRPFIKADGPLAASSR